MTSNYLSLAAAILAFLSVPIVGLSLLIESYGNLSVRLPRFLVKYRTKMADNRGKWGAIEFWLRVWGFAGAIVAAMLQIMAISIKIWAK